jgi:hypothetical protein
LHARLDLGTVVVVLVTRHLGLGEAISKHPSTFSDISNIRPMCVLAPMADMVPGVRRRVVHRL